MKALESATIACTLLTLTACDLGTTYEGAGPMYYETHTRDPALQMQSRIAGMGNTPTDSMPSEGTAEFIGGFVGRVGGCGFDVDCNSSNNVYGRSWVSADFASGEVEASLSRLIIEYSETDEYGYHDVQSIGASVGTRTPGTITGNSFEGVAMSSGNYYGNNDFLIVGELDGTFKGTEASGVSANFSGSIAKVTGGYPLQGYETLTGRISAEIQQ